jgi:hypothetical protein
LDIDGMQNPEEKNPFVPYTPVADKTNFVQSARPILGPYSKSQPSQGEQMWSGAINMAAGFSTVAAGFAVTLTTGISVVGALGGVTMMMTGMGQMAVGASQFVDGATSKKSNVPLVGGVTELVGYGLTEKTGNPYYRLAGAGVDLGASFGYGASKTIPLLSNAADIYKNASLSTKSKVFNFGRYSVDLYSDASTINNNLIYPDYSTENIEDSQFGGGENLFPELSSTQSISFSIGHYEGFHTIEKGESLSSISNKYGTSIERLLNLNPQITDKDKIFEGNKIKVHDIKVIISTNANNGN